MILENISFFFDNLKIYPYIFGFPQTVDHPIKWDIWVDPREKKMWVFWMTSNKFKYCGPHVLV